MEITAGTAGHIDHGKTALVKALTGTDADRLPEEKRRGITIDLGFAELDLGDVRIGFVDVPGHEKFVKNMLAGAQGIDLVMLVIAADEGVMPQTREHFDICRLLEIRAGLIALTKADLVDGELLELAKADVAALVKGSFLEDSPVIPVSAKTEQGLPELKAALHRAASEISGRQNKKVTFLPIDRVFTVKGFGTVVTGTLASGEINNCAELEILPGQKRVRVRNVQVHGSAVETAFAGQRTAVNIGGIDKDKVERGMALAAAGVFRPSQNIDARIEVLPSAAKPLKDRQRVRIHIGTAEILVRLSILNESREIAPGETSLAQLRFESSLMAVPGDRFVIRSYSPQVTIAGGLVIDGHGVRHKRQRLLQTRARLEQMSRAVLSGDNAGLLTPMIENSGEHGITLPGLQARTGWRSAVVEETLQALIADNTVVDAGGVFLIREIFSALTEKALAEVAVHLKNDPLAPGISKEVLRDRIFTYLPPEVFQSALSLLEQSGKLMSEKEFIRLAGRRREMSAEFETVRDKIVGQFRAAGLTMLSIDAVLPASVNGTAVSPADARKILQLLLGSGELARVSPDFVVLRNKLDELIARVRQHAAGQPDRILDIIAFKEFTGLSRKYSIPLLEYFDRENITRRVNGIRIVL